MSITRLASQADMDIDAASVDAEADTLTNIDADTLTHVDADSKPQDGEEQSMTPTTSDQPPSIPLAVSSNKRKHAPVNTSASKSKVARSVNVPHHVIWRLQMVQLSMQTFMNMLLQDQT